MTGHFPTVVGSNEQALSGTVDIASDSEVVRGVVTPNADAFLVQDGRIATLPVPQDLVGMKVELVPGQARRLPAHATLVPCDPGAAMVQRGRYELYARVVLHDDDGSSLESIGGPWPLEVR